MSVSIFVSLSRTALAALTDAAGPGNSGGKGWECGGAGARPSRLYDARHVAVRRRGGRGGRAPPRTRIRCVQPSVGRTSGTAAHVQWDRSVVGQWGAGAAAQHAGSRGGRAEGRRDGRRGSRVCPSHFAQPKNRLDSHAPPYPTGGPRLVNLSRGHPLAADATEPPSPPRAPPTCQVFFIALPPFLPPLLPQHLSVAAAWGRRRKRCERRGCATHSPNLAGAAGRERPQLGCCRRMDGLVVTTVGGVPHDDAPVADTRRLPGRAGRGVCALATPAACPR